MPWMGISTTLFVTKTAQSDIAVNELVLVLQFVSQLECLTQFANL